MPSLRSQRTADQVRRSRAVGLARRPRRRLPQQRVPRTVERDYAVRILAIMRAVRAEFEPLLIALPGLIERTARDRLVLDVGEGQIARGLIAEAEERLTQALSPVVLERLAEQFAQRTSTFQRGQLDRQVRAALGVDIFLADPTLPAIVDGFVNENVALIKGLARDTASSIEKTVTRGMQAGTRHTEIAKEIGERFAISERRARLIARDQIGKIYGQVNAARQQAIGVEKFIWRTAGDERVRPLHAQIDGNVYEYPDGHPSEGLPGEPIQCRCYAEPVLDAILEQV